MAKQPEVVKSVWTGEELDTVRLVLRRECGDNALRIKAMAALIGVERELKKRAEERAAIVAEVERRIGAYADLQGVGVERVYELRQVLAWLSVRAQSSDDGGGE